MRKQLWDLGVAHPGLFSKLSNDELVSIQAVATQQELGTHLMACKDSTGPKEFVFAIGKLLTKPGATPATPPTPARGGPPAKATPATPAKPGPAKPKADDPF